MMALEGQSTSTFPTPPPSLRTSGGEGGRGGDPLLGFQDGVPCSVLPGRQSGEDQRSPSFILRGATASRVGLKG